MEYWRELLHYFVGGTGLPVQFTDRFMFDYQSPTDFIVGFSWVQGIRCTFFFGILNSVRTVEFYLKDGEIKLKLVKYW